MVNQTKFINFKKHLKMKKLFFSAVALIAFSSVSMANTIEIDEKKVMDDPKTDFCSNVAADVMISVDPGCNLPDATYNAMYQDALNLCLKNTTLIKH